MPSSDEKAKSYGNDNNIIRQNIDAYEPDKKKQKIESKFNEAAKKKPE